MFKINFFILFLMLFFTCKGVFAQQSQNQEKTSTQSNALKQFDFQIDRSRIDLQSFDILKQIEPQVTTGIIFNDQLLEGAVDANKYIVGPNDIFSLGIWGVVNEPLPIAVTPEGSLVIPSVGEVAVTGLTLAEAKENVISAVKKRFISAVITLTLISPRRFMITITGVGQGNYPTSAIMRASTIIAFVISDSVSLIKSRTSFGDRSIFSLRNITLKRKSGQTQRIDLYKYFATQDDRFNPFLREGDVLNIPKYDWEERFVSVHGAVQFPGTFEYIEGDDLETAIQLVRGVTTMADTDSIIVSRLAPSADKMSNFYLSLDKDKNYKLMPNDRVIVQVKREQRGDFRVLVLGEVMKPGPYPITRNNTKLIDIINMAGGPTPNSSLANSEVYRKIDTFFIADKKRDSLESAYTKRLNDIISNKEEKESFDLDMNYQLGRVNVDFEKLIEGDESQNIIVRSGDLIYIPDSKKEVYVYGQVNKPGFVPYKEGADYMYYIEAAGGFGERADEDEVRVIKFKTREWLEPDEAKIQSSDFVYVPKVIKRDFAYDMDLISKVASVIVSVVTLTLLVIQSQK
ncbi:MAG: SLBB domain-containing protein [Chlorobi bacterium]|nr:SLBB domain-containing protein [Chlorobiota bacterium]MCI0716187.1 SLBB domain-containing protein [Chlorobiota bacterium]